MPEERLDAVLKNWRETPTAPLRGDFESAVWRRIATREREAAGGEGWWEFLGSLLLSPQRAALALGVVVIAAAGVTSLAPGGVRGAQNRVAAASHGLGLEVFSGRAPALPSTLITHR